MCLAVPHSLAFVFLNGEKRDGTMHETHKASWGMAEEQLHSPGKHGSMGGKDKGRSVDCLQVAD